MLLNAVPKKHKKVHFFFEICKNISYIIVYDY
jgi:hypothetical protein